MFYIRFQFFKNIKKLLIQEKNDKSFLDYKIYINKI